MKALKYITAILIATVFFSCAKEAITSDADFQKNLLSGTGNFQNTSHTWRLDSLVIGTTPQKLTAIQKQYTKTFTRAGSYTDSDGYAGTWAITTAKKLDVATTSAVTNVTTKTSYDITVLNAAQLQLKLTGSGGTYQYFFVIAN
jgi:hypothetical protein